MKRPPRFRPALESLEDRWCPTFLYNINGGAYMTAVPGSTNNVGTLSQTAAFGVIDNDTNPNLFVKYVGSNEWRVDDLNNGAVPTYFLNCSSVSVTMGGTGFDTLLMDGRFDVLGTGNPIPNFVSVALDGVAPNPAQPNTFTIHKAYIQNSSLFVLGQGEYNSVSIGDGNTFTNANNINITYRNASDGFNVGTPNLSNTTVFDRASMSGLSLTSQNATSDIVHFGLPTGPAQDYAIDYGSAAFSFNGKDTVNLSTANASSIGSFAANGSFTVSGGGSNSVVTLGDGTDAFSDQAGTTFIDGDRTSGGTVVVNDNVALLSTTRFDDYQTVNIDTTPPAVSPQGVNLGNGLTIWNIQSGTTATVGSNANACTVTGNVEFDTGFIAGDTDDNASTASVTDTFTLNSKAQLTGNLAANLNMSMDTLDVEGHVTGSVAVSTGSGNQTIQVGQLFPLAAMIDSFLNINFGGTGAKELDFNGTVGTGSSTGNTLIVTGNSGNSFVQVNLGKSGAATQGTVNGNTRLLLAAATGAEIDFYGLHGLNLAGELTATGNHPPSPNFNFFTHGLGGGGSGQVNTSGVSGFNIV
jgi:hypothetical protein